VKVRDSGGWLVQIVRWREPRQRVTKALVEERIRRFVPVDVSRAVIDERTAAFRATPVLELLPAYLQMHVDTLGRTWMEDCPLDQRSRWWTLLVRDGSVLGRVETPIIPGAHGSSVPLIVQVLADRVALSWRDVDGAVHLGYCLLNH